MASFLRATRVAMPLAVAFVLSFAASGCASETDDNDDVSQAAEELHGNGGGDHDGHGSNNGGGHGNGGHGGGGHGHGHGPGHHPWAHHGRQDIPQPQGAYFAAVNANGTGCPDGSWDVALSPDGETFTLRFNAYEATVDVGQAVDIKDCLIDINLTSPQGVSFAVGSFFYQGYVFLEKDGMSAQQTASYYFDREREHQADRNQVTGPKDESYVFSDDIQPNRLAWSPCNSANVLHVKTRLAMRNTSDASGQGYINSAVLDGTLVQWKLKFRRC